MKRLLSLITAVILAFSCVNIAAAENNEKISYGQEKYIKFFADLEIFDTEYAEDDSVSRAELAEILTRLLKYDGSLDTLRGVVYNDVDVDYSSSKAINFMNVTGIMNGKSDHMFYPDDDITLGEASAAIVRMLGYSAKANVSGGYATGYTVAARSLGAMKGVPNELCGEYLGAGALARMLYNVLEVKMVSAYISGGEKVESLSDLTLLSDYLELEKGYGMVTGIKNMFLTGTSSYMLSDNEVKIGNEKYITDLSDMNSFFGYYVDFYYREEDDATSPVIYSAFKKSSTDELKIQSDDIKSADSGSISYREDGKNKDTSVKIASGAIVLYNGEIVSKMDKKYIPTNGYVRLIASQGSGYDVIVIFDYQSFVVKSQRDGKISFEYGNKYNNASSVDLGDSDVNAYVTYEGSAVSPQSIMSGDVVSIASSGNNYYVEISRKTLKGVLRSIQSSPFRIYIKGEPYKVDEEFYKLTESGADGTEKLEIGLSTTWYFDVMDKIVGMETTSNTMIYGYLSGVIGDEFGDKVWARIYDDEKKDFAVFNIPEKMYLNGIRTDASAVLSALKTFLAEREAATKIASDNTLTAIQPPIVKYMQDGSGTLTHIVTDMKIVQSTEDKYIPISDDYIILSAPYSDKVWQHTYKYFTTYLSSSGHIYGNGVKALQVPQSGEEKDFKSGEIYDLLPHTDNKTRPVIFYDLDFEFGVPGYMVYIIKESGSSVKVDHFYGAVNVSKGVECAYIEAYNSSGMSVTLETTDDDEVINAALKLSEGDLFQITTGSDGRVGAIEKFISYFEPGFDMDFYTKTSGTSDYNAYDRLMKNTQGSTGMLFAKVNKAKNTVAGDIINFNLIDEDSSKVNLVRKFSTSVKTILIYDGKSYSKGTVEDIEQGDYICGITYSGTLDAVVVFKDSEHYQEFHVINKQ